MNIKLIVGLENPGPRYAATRHNLGGILVAQLAERFSIRLHSEHKFNGRVGRGDVCGHDVRFLVPDTYMNLSGQAVGSVAQFFKIEPEEILVVHDEMAFDPGQIRLKQGGGANGHNGLRDIIDSLGGSGQFVRLRIGVGHPGSSDAVTAHLTSHNMPQEERNLVYSAWELEDSLWDQLIYGDFQKVMNKLHAPDPGPDQGSDSDSDSK